MNSLEVHMVYDANMELTLRSRLVEDWNRPEDPFDTTYKGVVSREKVRIELIYESLNELDILAADINIE